MQIYTSYFAKIKDLPQNILPVAISRSVPKGMDIISLGILAPDYQLLSYYKTTSDSKEIKESNYINTFNQQLSKISASGVVNTLEDLLARHNQTYTDKKDSIALICYERPEDFCHRHIVAKWLTYFGYFTKEYEFTK